MVEKLEQAFSCLYLCTIKNYIKAYIMARRKNSTNSWLISIAVLVGAGALAIKFSDDIKPTLEKIGVAQYIY